MTTKQPWVFSWLRVTRWDELRHRWHGRRDGKKRIPVLPDDEGAAIPPTPHEGTLVNRRDEVVARVRQELSDATRETCEQIDGRYQLMATIETEVATLRAELAVLRTEQSKEDIGRRGAGEGNLPAGTIHKRRTVEQQKVAAPLTARIAAKEKELDSTLIEIAKLETDVTTRLLAAQSRADQYAAFVEGLDMRYWRALLRVHEEKEKLANRKREWPALAAWTTEHDYRVVLELGPPPGGSVTESGA